MPGGERVQWTDAAHKARTVHLRAHRAAETHAECKTPHDRKLWLRYQCVATQALALSSSVEHLLEYVDAS